MNVVVALLLPTRSTRVGSSLGTDVIPVEITLDYLWSSQFLD